MRIHWAVFATLVMGLVASDATLSDDLARNFRSPPDAAKPWAYWWWLNGHVSRDGITQDLEAMKRQGINGVLIFNAGGGETPPGLKFLSPEWRAMYKHALAEAGRLGMEVSVNLCDGWDCGGPWITPECANKKLVYSETQVDGPAQTSGVSGTQSGSAAVKLPQPPTLDNYYRDVAVVAFPERPASPVAPLRVTANSEVGGYCDEKNWPAADAADRDPETFWRSGPAPSDEGRRLLFEYAEPLRATALLLVAPNLKEARPCRLEASEDGKQFRTVVEFSLRTAEQRIALPATAARWFRLTIGSVSRSTGVESSSWIWYPEGNPAAAAPPGTVYLRRSLALPAGCKVSGGIFTATADNSFTLHVNGQEAGGNVKDPAGFHRLVATDVARFLRPGENVLAVTAGNGAAEPNPAGFIGRLNVVLTDGRRVDLSTDEQWRASRQLAEGWQKAGFNDGSWPAALKVAPYGGGPWGKPAAADTDFDLAEACLLRAGDEPRLRPGTKWWVFKSANRSFWDWPKQGPAVLQDEYSGPDVCDVRCADVVDLTSRMRSGTGGTLEWQPPPGRWTILRFGYTLQGQRTRAGSTVGGYEADMLGSAGIECHFKNLAEPLLADAGDAVGRTLKFLHVDSYELGADIQGQQPTWSSDFRREFQARRGYDLLPYLPALARRVVDGREKTGRFFWDVRATIGDLMAERFFARFAQLAHARGVGMHSETGYGTYPHPHFDGLRCAGMCDVTMGEFWHGTDIMSQFDPFCNVIRSVASAAHVYGRPIVQAEAFTSWDHFVEHPFGLKALGDEAFCDGLNRMVFHQYTHQPRSGVAPGWQYGAGTHIDRHITWWPMADAWFKYLARCQYLLQAGRFHADVCYFYGEGATKYVPGRDHFDPHLPSGCDADCVNADVLHNRFAVRNGRLVLPDGTSYRLLVLPAERTMSAAVLRRIRELIEAGAVVYGLPPQRSPGLGGYPKCDQEVRALADSMWGRVTDEKGERSLGKGRLFWNVPLASVLRRLDVPMDCEVLSPPPGLKFRFIHRALAGADVYFVSNQQAAAQRVRCLFRVTGTAPELWDPVSGRIARLENCQVVDRRTMVPIAFEPRQSFFIVFRKGPPEPGTALVSCDRAFPNLRPAAALGGPWEVSFDPKWGGPRHIVFDRLADWTEHPSESVRHYSGTATYRRTFDAPAAAGAFPPGPTYLDLGTLHNVARVRLNGKDLGVVWCAPWRVDISDSIRPKDNRLEIEVVNLWPNRLIGDAGLPSDKRHTKTNVAFSKDQPLLPSGLIGPVTIQRE